MFDVVAMIPGVRRKPARLYCGGGTLQPFDLDDEVGGVLLAEPSLLEAAKFNSSSSSVSSHSLTLTGGVVTDMAWLELP